MIDESIENLPEAVLEVQRKLEKFAFVSVQWVDDPEMTAGGQATWGDDGETPTVRFREFSHRMAAEELLHLRLDQTGYPRLGRPGANWAITGAATLLHNLLQHQIIYPQMEKMELTPGAGECKAISKIVESRKAKTDAEVKACQPHQLVAVSTMIYICSRFYCHNEMLAVIDQQMDQIPEAEDARIIGDRLIPVFDLDENSNEEEYRRLLKLLVDELQLTDDVDLMG